MKGKPLSYVGVMGSLMAVLGCAAMAQDKGYDPKYAKYVQIIDVQTLGKVLDLPKDTVVLVAITKDENTRKYFIPQGANITPVKVVPLPLNVGKSENFEIQELKPASMLTRLKFKRNPQCELLCDTMLGIPICFYPCEP